MKVSVNYLAILLAAVASMAVGFVWYGPNVFGKTWMKLKGVSMAKKDLAKGMKGMPKFYAITFGASLLTAFVLNHVMVFAMTYFAGMYSTVTTGLVSALWMWLGFVMPTQLGGAIFGDRKWKVLLIDTGYQLVALVSMAVVIAVV